MSEHSPDGSGPHLASTPPAPTLVARRRNDADGMAKSSLVLAVASTSLFVVVEFGICCGARMRIPTPSVGLAIAHLALVLLFAGQLSAFIIGAMTWRTIHGKLAMLAPLIGVAIFAAGSVYVYLTYLRYGIS